MREEVRPIRRQFEQREHWFARELENLRSENRLGELAEVQAELAALPVAVLRVRGLVDLRLQDPTQEKTRRFLSEKLFASVPLARALSVVTEDRSALTLLFTNCSVAPKKRWSCGEGSVNSVSRCLDASDGLKASRIV